MSLAYGVFLTILDVITQKWKQRNLPGPLNIGGDVNGQVVIVTGPTSGIGEKVASNLAQRGAIVILACRNLTKGDALKRRLLQSAKDAGNAAPKLEVQELDVASLSSIRSFSNHWVDSGRKIDCLINNAGIFSILGNRAVTVDNFEAHLGTNYLGAFLLTVLLLPALRKAGTPELPARVILVTSVVHFCSDKLQRDDMNSSISYSPLRAYGHSKLAQNIFVSELRRRLQHGKRIAVFACHPGECSTDIIRTLPTYLQSLYHLILPPLLITAEKGLIAAHRHKNDSVTGGLSTLFCGTSNPIAANLRPNDPEAFYIGPGCTIESPSAKSTDPDEGAWLWDWSCKAVSLEGSANFLRQ